MTKFLFHGIWCVVVLILCACVTALAVVKMGDFTNPTLVHQDSVTPAPPFLKIKKLGVRKRIISPEKQLFYCTIDKSCMELHFSNTSLHCRELLSHLTGCLQTETAERAMFFRGTGGLLNYKDYSLSVYNCCFSINTPDAEPEMGRGMAEGGMKVLSLSLLKN
ncbi:DUF1137 domain-containing protein [Chlamydia trachomatis]|uniref:Exported protein n=1 Tax=Chlamydia trachomatis serovar L2 (strain ATCC VR-902B / DSM 19102 / 434/Bu) TaxID=471472 RepID=A0A0H3MJP9_CHLT2|nr:DUF1137 domain-containing protein [Chlamydia trachomatis]AEJ77118.1 conserved hypothetical protein [Chlamydia trachomatis L2c]AGJ64107.1 hypothetical protein CTLINITIAL_00125 [Chlamydia trachomatis L2/434/Bu(i)]AGJ65047.1 hypothetical protein CTLFINAL_00125 [Chlamydia trachomatis L2/434/Bu(f)]AGR95018.1 hypothetical protein CTRC46_03460 [Chlamydia trachomatis RC-L2(s)/46]AGR98739.1 hypothetical protein CTRC3_03490 [Chlamydia trachomatis RC-L2(s)/3]